VVRRIVVPPAHHSSNRRFDIGMSNKDELFYSGRRRFHRQQGVCGDFVNFKIQFAVGAFKYDYRNMVYVCVFIEVSVYKCILTRAFVPCFYENIFIAINQMNR
jgi:hypothetical protein